MFVSLFFHVRILEPHCIYHLLCSMAYAKQFCTVFSTVKSVHYRIYMGVSLLHIRILSQSKKRKSFSLLHFCLPELLPRGKHCHHVSFHRLSMHLHMCVCTRTCGHVCSNSKLYTLFFTMVFYLTLLFTSESFSDQLFHSFYMIA